MIRLTMLMFAVLVPLTAVAGGVYLNGVRIDGVKDQTFEDATVRIDSDGNVHIDAPRYHVTGGGSSSNGETVAERSEGEREESGSLSRRYFLVTRQSQVGATQYDIDVYVNARFIRKLRSDESQVIAELTEYLRPGRNRVLLTARKSIEGGRRSHSANHTFRVVIGEGDRGGKRVMIDRPIIQFERTAAEVEDVSREFELNAR